MSKIRTDGYWQLFDAEWVRREYVERGRSCPDIARELKCGSTTVYQALKRHGIQARPAGGGVSPYPLLQDAGWLLREYVEENRSLEDVAKEVGCNHQTLRVALRRCGIPVRPAVRPGSNRTHGHAGVGEHGSGTLTYVSWHAMVQRCTDPNHKSWASYGGIGVKVHEPWLVFPNFLVDPPTGMGERPPGTTLGRFGDVGNYEPGNCAWQTDEEQLAEKRNKRAAGRRT